MHVCTFGDHDSYSSASTSHASTPSVLSVLTNRACKTSAARRFGAHMHAQASFSPADIYGLSESMLTQGGLLMQLPAACQAVCCGPWYYIWIEPCITSRISCAICRCGHGSVSRGDGYQYSGQWLHDLPHGQGTSPVVKRLLQVARSAAGGNNACIRSDGMQLHMHLVYAACLPGLLRCSKHHCNAVSLGVLFDDKDTEGSRCTAIM